MLCYLAGMEPYYLKRIKDGPFQPKIAECDAKPEAKSTESLSWTYTRYKTLLNELANDGVNLSKHEINVGFVNSLPEKWLTFSQGMRNADHTQTLDLADIYERTSEEYLRDLDIKYHERALLANSKRFIKRRNNFSGQKANENTECYKCGNKGHFARDSTSSTRDTYALGHVFPIISSKSSSMANFNTIGNTDALANCIVNKKASSSFLASSDTFK
ncbi:retrovirus-related pol polyprotein from transposon TNT 1-94 [Tanacetum coccineum]